jgi:hypothetical protein
MFNLNQIIEKLLDVEIMLPKYESPISKCILPFLDNQFIVERYFLNNEDKAVTIRDTKNKDNNLVGDILVGYFQYQGIVEVNSRYVNFHEDSSFRGFESEMQDYFAQEITGVNKKPYSQAIYVRDDYKLKYSGLGKMMVSLALELMIEELRTKEFKNSEKSTITKEYLDAYRKKPIRKIPIFMGKRVHTSLFSKYYQAERIPYETEPEDDLVIYLDFKHPELEIKLKQ